ncbi:hypothetical protein CTAYLR_004865 [Chrysophaeum taylorii]|uniref:PH domain-containing protein n=1 Tax=Chrysophaeum taylorii TaxID=2483200 RepID=A0AAD7XIZ7_9STRA|nr:hypothetical protein CTAYLR_004865 [Chrysophaeum taylorii]
MSKGGLVGSAQSGADRYRRRLLAAAGLSNNLLFSNLNTTVTIKSSPPKSAEETARLGIVSGFLTKRNEQHSWQRRFCALVPQSLLYYFEDEGSDTPRGIIDLEYYTDITAQPNNVVKMSAPESSHRTFYFQADSEEEMNSWMSALVRERYFVLRDERDAYQELQYDFQAQSEAQADEVKRAQAERARALELEGRTLREEAEVAHQLHELLESVDPQQRPSADGRLEDDAVAALDRSGRALVERVSDLEARLSESKTGAERLEEELREYQDEVSALTAELATEAAALQKEQVCKQTEMEDVASFRRELEEGEVNLGIIERTKQSAENRVAELTEQKKLLVREVKASRKLLAEKKASAVLREPTDDDDYDDDDAASPPPLAPPPHEEDFDAAPTAPLPEPPARSLSVSMAMTPPFKLPFSFDSPSNATTTKRTAAAAAAAKPALTADDDEPRPAFVLRCKRCDGTLEGPRNSTCTCAEPLLTDPPPATQISAYLKTFASKSAALFASSKHRASPLILQEEEEEEEEEGKKNGVARDAATSYARNLDDDDDDDAKNNAPPAAATSASSSTPDDDDDAPHPFSSSLEKAAGAVTNGAKSGRGGGAAPGEEDKNPPPRCCSAADDADPKNLVSL